MCAKVQDSHKTIAHERKARRVGHASLSQENKMKRKEKKKKMTQV
jgi:hypothetical protein